MPAPDRKRRLTAFSVAMAVLIAAPLAVVASDAFTDVSDTNVHHDDITWLADADVTKGCNPPANTEFCPGDPVLRQQMASFMRRLAENEVVNAATANEADHATTADSATTADDAETLDGEDSVAYVTQIDGVTCAGGDCPNGSSVEVTPILSQSLTVPASGVLEISYTHQTSVTGPTNDFLQTWIAINQTANSGCGTWFFAPADPVPGTYAIVDYDGDVDLGTNSGSTAVNVPDGTHEIVLCALGTEAFSSAVGSIATVWSQAGSGVSLSAATSVSEEDLDQLKSILGDDVEPIE